MHLYLPDDLLQKIALLSLVRKEGKAEVIRKALEHGLKDLQPTGSPSAQALLDLAKLADMLPKKGPRDVSVNHDYYAWGGKKK